MKAITKKLVKFLELINISGSIEIKECIIKGSKEDLRVYAKTPSNAFALKAVLKGDYSELETIGIDDLTLLRKVISLNREVEEIDIAKKENTIVLKANKTKTKLLLRNTKYILTVLEEKDYEEKTKSLKDNQFTLTKDNIADLVRYYDLFKSKVTIVGDKKEIVIKVGAEENVGELKIDIKETVKPFDVYIAGFFVEALSQIGEDVTISAKTDAPIIINYKTDDYSIEYLLAPLKKKK